MLGAASQQLLRYTRLSRADGPGSWRFGLLALSLTTGVFPYSDG